MLTKTSTSVWLIAALAISSIGTGCSSDDNSTAGATVGSGGAGGRTSTTLSATTITSAGSGTTSSTSTVGGSSGAGGGGGSGGGTGGGSGGAGMAGSGGGDASTGTAGTGGGGSAGSGGAGNADAAMGSDGTEGGTGDGGDGAIAGPQAETAVILIDDVIVAAKPDGGAPDGSVDGGAAGAIYSFDADIQGWHYTPFGSTPNLGAADTGGAERAKLSDASQSQLAFDSTNDANGQIDASGVLKLTVGFLAANDQIDAQAFSAQPNNATQWKVWNGFAVTAKIKLVSGGNLNPACPMRAWLYITTGTDYATGISPTVNLTRGVTDWETLTFDLDNVNALSGAPDPTQINQLGIQIATGTCP